MPGVSGLKALRIIRITRIVPCLSLAGMLDGGKFMCGVLMDGMDGGGISGWCVFLFPEKMMFL